MELFFEEEMTDFLKNLMEAEAMKMKIQENKSLNPTIIGSVNLSRLIKDWGEIVNCFKANLNYPLKQQRIYQYLVEDMQNLPLETFKDDPYVNLPCGISLNILIFKADFDLGVQNIKEQIKEERKNESPIVQHIDDLVDQFVSDKNFNQKFVDLMQYQFRFVFNRWKELHPDVKKNDVQISLKGNEVLMKIKNKVVGRVSISLNEIEDLLIL